MPLRAVVIISFLNIGEPPFLIEVRRAERIRGATHGGISAEPRQRSGRSGHRDGNQQRALNRPMHHSLSFQRLNGPEIPAESGGAPAWPHLTPFCPMVAHFVPYRLGGRYGPFHLPLHFAPRCQARHVGSGGRAGGNEMIAGGGEPAAAAGGPARHVPVLGRQVIEYLQPRDGGLYVTAPRRRLPCGSSSRG